MQTKAASQDAPAYGNIPAKAARKPRDIRAAYSEDQILQAAMKIMESRMRGPGYVIESPSAMREYLRTRMNGLQHEEFGVLYMDAQHALIGVENLFRGTLTQTSVFPREVIKSALAHNAAAVAFFHNHPSGSLEPSRADEMLTTQLKTALSMVDVRVLDHIIVSHSGSMSFAERGLL